MSAAAPTDQADKLAEHAEWVAQLREHPPGSSVPSLLRLMVLPWCELLRWPKVIFDVATVPRPQPEQDSPPARAEAPPPVP